MKSFRIIGLLAMMMSAFAIGAFAQNVTVNPGGGNYPDLATAFANINNGTHTGAVTVTVINDTTEAATAVLNASGTGSASYTSVLVTATGARTVSGTLTTPLINLNGADNVTINGTSGGGTLTLSNLSTSATASTIQFIADATANTVTNTNVLGSSTGVVGTAVSGNIVFSTGTTTGNDTNTISNCNIGPAGVNLPNKLIFALGSTASVAIENSGVTINNNNLFDFFAAAQAFRAIDVNGGNTDWTISNNRLYQTATRTFTSATSTTSAGIRVGNTSTTSTANNFQVTGNTIGFADNVGGGVFTITGGGTGQIKFYAIHLLVNTSTAPIVASAISGNTVAGISLTTAASGTTTGALFMGLYPQTGLINTTGNTVGSQTATGSITVSSSSTSTGDTLGIFNFSSANSTISGNNIGGITATNSSTGSAVLGGIRCDLISSVTCTVSNNLVGGTIANSLNNTATATGSRDYGIETATSINTVTGNTIRNMTNLAPNIGTGASSSIVGISQTSSAIPQIVSQNTVHTLSNTNATAAVSIVGISNSAATTGTANVFARNFIHSFSLATSGAGILRGINVTAGTTTYQNNMIRLGIDAFGNSVTGAYDIAGINETVGTNNFYFNSIFIEGNSGTSNLFTFAFSSSVTTNTRNILDNIFANDRSVTGGTGASFAAQYGGTLPNPAGLTSNYNIYFAQLTANTIRNSGNAYTLAAWRTASGGQDVNSIQAPSRGSINFVNPTGTAATVDLHLQSPTLAEGAGTPIAAVTDDFDGQTRSTLTPTDIGADAGNFTAIDVSAPAISYTPLANTSLTTNRTISVTISDATGVATGGNAPRIYFNKNGGAYVSTQCVLASGTAQNGTYNCTIDYTLLGGVVATDVIRYFVVAQDTLGNVGANPGGGFAATNVNTVTTPPTTPNQYTIVTAVAATVNVGSAETITSLTNAGGLFAQLNAGVLNGNVTVNITSDLTGELGTVALNQFAEDGVGGYRITIKPSGAARSITGSSAGALILLNGADRVTIDGSLVGGGIDRSLTITNTNTGTGAGVIHMGNTASGNGANDNVVRAVNIQGNAAATITTLGGITTGGATPGSIATAPNNNNTIDDNSIQSVVLGIGSLGTSAAAKNTGTQIRRNIMTGTGNFRIGRIGIYTVFEDGIRIIANRIDGIVNVESADAVGIAVGQQGILTTFAAGAGVSNAQISRNYIGTVQQNNTFSAVGIIVGSSAVGTNTVDNNMVAGVNGNATSGDIVTGIYIGTQTGGTQRVYYNSVSMTGSRGATTSQYGSFALSIAGGDQPVDVRNNALLNSQTQTGGGLSGNSYAIGTDRATFVNMTSDYNDLFVSGAQGVIGLTGALQNTAGGGTGTDRATLAAWQTATGKDANSLSVDPMFTSTTDLHLQAGSPLIDAALPLVVVNDFDDQIRGLAFAKGAAGDAPEGAGNVDIGADEFGAPTAATAAISGRVKIARGNGIRNVTVTLVGGAFNEPITTTTGANGQFRFPGLPTGQTYVITVSARRYSFTQPSRTVSFSEEVIGLDFVGEQTSLKAAGGMFDQ